MDITDTNRYKKTAEWFYSTVFRDEPLRPRQSQPDSRIPSLLRAARSLETNQSGHWQSRETIFMKQGKLLAAYEDDFDFTGSVVRYYPTYQSLTDSELRGYFSWRTKLRRGDVRETSLSFAFLYVYELINQIGIKDPMDGFIRLQEFRDAYGKIDRRIGSYLNQWILDYVVYYELDANLLAGIPQVLFDRSVAVLELIRQQEQPKVIWAVKQLAPKWLGRSKFYREHQADCDTVIFRVLGRVSDHCAARCKRSFTEQYFGIRREYQVRLFGAAVFCDPLKKRKSEFALDERCVYRCQNGLWTVTKSVLLPDSGAKLEELLKTIDALMREEYGYGHPIGHKTNAKWLLKLIREEIRSLLAEQKSAEEKKITIDYSRLEKIRQDAAVTREKLIVDEEEDVVPEKVEPPAVVPPVETPPADAGNTPLNPAEYRLLQCLLYGHDYSWVQSEGYLLSVLADGINEKLYDTFLDSVLDDTPAPVEDYIDDLKEMVHP